MLFVALQPRFVKGAGSQLMHTSVSNHKNQWGMINDRAQQVLSTEERELLVYYLKGYEGRQITMHALSLGIAELLDSPSKVSEVTFLFSAKWHKIVYKSIVDKLARFDHSIF